MPQAGCLTWPVKLTGALFRCEAAGYNSYRSSGMWALAGPAAYLCGVRRIRIRASTMTLCIAWRDHNSAIHLASDSRVSRRGNPVADSMAKVYRLDATLIVRRPSARSGRSEHPVQLGVAIAGAALPHFVLAQTLGHIVRRVHAVEWDQDSPPPLDPLMKTVCKVLRPVTQAFGFMEPQHARLKLVIAGRCPGNETNRAFVVESDGDDPTYHEVLRPSDDPVYPFGDVDERLRERCLSASNPLQAVVEARDDP